MARYYASDFDFSEAQEVEAIGTTAFVMRRSTWEGAGLLDERFRWAMVDLAYEYMLGKKGYKLFYTPCAEVIHFGSQTVNQDVLKTLREQCQGFIDFSDAYDYFGKGRLIKLIVRVGIRVRYYLKVLGYYVSSDKRVIKGPGRPTKEQAGTHRATGGNQQPGGSTASSPREAACSLIFTVWVGREFGRQPVRPA